MSQKSRLARQATLDEAWSSSEHSAFEAFKTSRLEEWEKLRARVESDEFAAEWEAQKGQRKIQEQEARLEMAWLEKGLIAFLALTFAALFSWMIVDKIQDLRTPPAPTSN